MEIVTVRVLAPDVTSISQGDQTCPVVDGVVALPAAWLSDLGIPVVPLEGPPPGVPAPAPPPDGEAVAAEALDDLKAAVKARTRRKA